MGHGFTHKIHAEPLSRVQTSFIALTALVAFLQVAVAGLHRGALAVVVEAVAGASTLLDAPPTRHRTMGPFRPQRPSVLGRVPRCAGFGGGGGNMREGGREEGDNKRAIPARQQPLTKHQTIPNERAKLFKYAANGVDLAGT